MPYQFSLDIPADDPGYKVEASHFGLNFVADFERIGAKDWESFDEVAASMGAENLRYPGGVTAEKGFDITDPNASTIVLSDGSTRKTLGAYDFGNFCAANDYSASYIIPTIQLTRVDPITGKLVFDQAYEQYVIDFVFGTLVATSGNVTMYEIGNEYESYMTSQEYGKLVNELAPLIQEGIDLYAASYGPLESEPDIAIQVWSQNANETGTLQTSDLAKRADAVFKELSLTSANLIDTVVTHWYLKDKAKTYEQVYNTIERDIKESMSILDAQSELFGNDVEMVVSEYNANHNEVQFFGMAQIPVLVKMFAEFVQSGMDQLDFWSAQYHATSFALDDGTLTAVGAAVSYLSDVLPGLEPIDVETGSTSVGAVFFSGEEVSVLAVSSISTKQQDFSFALSQPDACYVIVRTGYLTVDTSEADGSFKSFVGLATYNEPDLAGEIIWDDTVQSLDEMFISLDAYQTVFIEVVNIAPDLETDSYGSQYYTFQDSSNGISVWLAEGYIASEGFEGSFHFQKQVRVEGSQYSDWFVVNFGYVNLSTGKGNDFVEVYRDAYGSVALGDGSDSAVLYSTDIFVDGGNGKDAISAYGSSTVLKGGGGNDSLIAQGDNITVIYGISDGDDTVSSSHFDTLIFDLGENAELAIQKGEYKVYETDGNVVLDFTNGGSVTFVDLSGDNLIPTNIGRYESSVLLGTSGLDTLAGYEGNDSLFGGNGNDRLDGGQHGDLMEGGLGNDTYVVDDFWDVVVNEAVSSKGGGLDTVLSWASFTLPTNVEVLQLQGSAEINGFGGSGADTLVGNSGRNLLDGGGGNDRIDGGSSNDTLVGGAGADTLIGGAWQDTFVYKSPSESGTGKGKSDVISGFETGADRIDLSLIDANQLVSGDQAFRFIGSAGFSGKGSASAGELRIVSVNSTTFNIEADTNGDRVADMLIQVTGIGISAGDLIL